jgi:nucleotide-binding universal stress UspA family protein
MFKKILFATSATMACDPAARVAFNLCRRYQAKMTLFHVIEARSAELHTVNDRINELYAEYLSKNQDCQISTVTGEPCPRILEEMEKTRPDLLVMGVSTRGEAGLENAIKHTESSFQKIVKASLCPVLIVNRPAASFWGTISNIVFATDFSKTSDQAFAFAHTLAKNTNSELHVFHAQNVSLTPGSAEFDQNAIEARRREKLNFSKKKFGIKMEDIERYSIEVWEGSPYIEIVKYARDKYADLIIVAQDSQNPGSQTQELGSTVKQVILRAGCPVLCINKQ